MSPDIAAVVYAIGILVLFWLDRNPEARTSKALGLPIAYLFLSGSRPVSGWLAILGLGQAVSFNSPDQYLDGSPVDRNVYLAFLLVGVLVLIKRRPDVQRILRTNLPLVVFFLYCFLSVLWSDYTFVSFKRWTKAICDLVMVLIVITDPEPIPAIKRFLSWPAFVLVPLSVLFIKYFPELGREYNRWTWLPAYSGVTETKNELGMLCLIFGLASLWRFLSEYREPATKVRTRQLIAHGTILLMVFWLFWMANSMTSLSCFLLGGVLIFAAGLPRFYQRPAFVHFAVSGMIVASALVLFSGSGGGVLSTMGRDPTLTGRTEIWNAVLSVSGSPLLGTGFESFWLGDRITKVWAMTMKGLQEAHNGYLEVYLNLGWIGAGLLCGIILAGYRNVTEVLRYDAQAGSLMLALFVTTMVYSFTEAGFRMTTLTWISLLLVVTAPWTCLDQQYTPEGAVNTSAGVDVIGVGVDATFHSVEATR